MNSIKRQKDKKIKTLSIIIVSALVIYSALAFATSWWPFNSDAVENQRVNDAGISVDDDSNNDGKEPIQPSEIIGEGENTSEQNPEKLTANVGLAFASVVDGNLEVRAFTTSEIHPDGTCTAIVTKGSEVIRQSSKSFIDATTSQCNPIFIPLDTFSDKSGVWQVSVEYESEKYIGKSEAYEVRLDES
jgi:hypothetical protein